MMARTKIWHKTNKIPTTTVLQQSLIIAVPSTTL
jgi:hypothetical protein